MNLSVGCVLLVLLISASSAYGQGQGVGAAASGCPLGFFENGATPSYHAQQTGFDEVVCGNETCEVPQPDGNQGLRTNVFEPCLTEVAPPGITCQELARQWSPACQVKGADFSGYSCGCQSDAVQNGVYCQRSCAKCSPVFVNSEGYNSGSTDELEPLSNLAYGIEKYQNPIPRIPCEPYDVEAVANAVRAMGEGDQTLDIPPTVRIGFHDACDYNKWSATGGADGRIANDPESWFAESRTLNQGLPCVTRLLGYFSDTSLSAGDAVQICAMVATELAGGPKFEDFNFEPGRAHASGISQDGLLPNPTGNNNMLRDFFYRAGLNDLDIVTIMGAHTLGGGQGDKGSGFNGTFTASPNNFSNDYYRNLIEYENVTDYNCNYFAPGVFPDQRKEGGGCHATGDSSIYLQLPTDRALLLDNQMRDHVVAFANNETLWFEQYARSIKKMSELGRDVSVQWCDYSATPTPPPKKGTKKTKTGKNGPPPKKGPQPGPPPPPPPSF